MGWVRAGVAAALLVVLATPVALADRPGKGKKAVTARGKGAAPAEREPKGPPSLKLVSVDLVAGQAVVLVGGTARAPGARLFVFHDDKDRHFIALDASCTNVAEGDPTGDEGQLRCTLELPRPYLKAHVVAVTLRLKGRDIAADELDVEARFAAARDVAASAPPPPARRPGGPALDDPAFTTPARAPHPGASGGPDPEESGGEGDD